LAEAAFDGDPEERERDRERREQERAQKKRKADGEAIEEAVEAPEAAEESAEPAAPSSVPVQYPGGRKQLVKAPPGSDVSEYTLHDSDTEAWISQDKAWIFYPNTAGKFEFKPLWCHAHTKSFFHQDSTTLQYLPTKMPDYLKPAESAKERERDDSERKEKAVPFHGGLQLWSHSESWPGRKTENEDRVAQVLVAPPLSEPSFNPASAAETSDP
jgi:hypothetical protein